MRSLRLHLALAPGPPTLRAASRYPQPFPFDPDPVTDRARNAPVDDTRPNGALGSAPAPFRPAFLSLVSVIRIADQDLPDVRIRSCRILARTGPSGRRPRSPARP